MILQLGPEAPAIARAGAAALLALHVSGAAAGIAFGWAAILARKGARLHQVAGAIFFVAMLTMSAVAAGVAPFLDEARWTNTTAGVLTFYLVATAWAAVRRQPNQVGRFERAAVAVPLGIVAMALGLAVFDGGNPGYTTVYVMAGVALIAAASDLWTIRQGGLSGRPRIARHLWRMTAALFVANGSYFFGQPRFVPKFLMDTGLNAVPPIAVLVLLAFWMARTRLPRLFKPAASAAQPARS